MPYFMSFLVFAFILTRKRESWLLCLFIVFLVPCYCTYSVTLPHGAVGWYALYDCVLPDHTH